jgi:hypothetical protein
MWKKKCPLIVYKGRFTRTKPYLFSEVQMADITSLHKYLVLYFMDAEIAPPLYHVTSSNPEL